MDAQAPRLTAPPPPRALPLRRDDGLTPAQSRTLVAAVACAHIVGLWALLQVAAVRDAVAQVAPMVVDLIAPPQPDTPPPPPPPPAPSLPVPQPRPQTPLLAAPSPAPAPAEAFTAAPPPVEPVQAAPAPPAPPAPVAAPAPVVPPAAPPRKVIPATAVQYLAEPPFEVPLAARRAGEHGVVWLRVVVSAQGLPVQVKVHKSSGYTRLDEQAVWAMRQARFKPYTEDGRAIEVEATAPVDYPAD